MIKNLEWKSNRRCKKSKYHKAQLPNDLGSLMIVEYRYSADSSRAYYDLYYTVKGSCDAYDADGVVSYPRSVTTLDDAKDMALDLLKADLGGRQLGSQREKIKRTQKTIRNINKVMKLLERDEGDGKE